MRHEKLEFKEGSWARDEDKKLLGFFEEDGNGSWPAKNGQQKGGTNRRMRWTCDSRPDAKRVKFSLQEENKIQFQALLGNRWPAKRSGTGNEIKTQLKKRLTRMSINPVTHKPYTNNGGSIRSKSAVNLSHMAQWESTRLEAEARLVRESKLNASNPFNLHRLNKATAQPPPPPILPPCLDILKVWQGAYANTYPTKSITISNAFFNSTGTLESSTSTLNHVENSSLCSVQIAGTGKLNQYTEIKDGMENAIQVHDIACPIDSTCIEDFSLKDSVQLGPLDNAVGCYDEYSFEENENYWDDDIFKLVSSPLGSQVL